MNINHTVVVHTRGRGKRSRDSRLAKTKNMWGSPEYSQNRATALQKILSIVEKIQEIARHSEQERPALKNQGFNWKAMFGDLLEP